ncbi:5-oxoprolinase-like [Hibiscus syriacus]|uniref:5-oxoprolinase-like n=1 Tax=Hibiscus syriacus TaxID=106335 RepID=A0A6A3D143_HIBSY|nr:5-oxoprolinase-like [Hibiscus syriacus]
MEKPVPDPRQPFVALIVGVTCMAGLSLAEALKSPKALAGPWKVYGSAFRPMPTWFPSSVLDKYIAFDATDAGDTADKLPPFSGKVTHVFWVAIQDRESEHVNVTVNATTLSNVLHVLNGGRCSRQPHHGSDRHPTLHGSREVVRTPSIIIGASSRSRYSTLLTLAVAANMGCRNRRRQEPSFGNRYAWEHFCDISDARVLAEQQIWAAVTDGAKNQAFNCTNGDFFTWKSVWKKLCDIFHLEFITFEESKNFDFVEFMTEKSRVWDEIVEKNGLYNTKLEEITCPMALKTVLHFMFQHVCSMNKSREFGFFGYAHTLKSIPLWVERLRHMKIIP